MKEPKAHYRIGQGDETFCRTDGQSWPCNTWRKWMKSDSYRIATLELRMTDTAHMISKMLDDITELKRHVHRINLIQDAQMKWLAALGNHTGLREGISIEQYTDEIDVPSAFGTVKLRAPGPLIFRVRFGDGEWKS